MVEQYNGASNLDSERQQEGERDDKLAIVGQSPRGTNICRQGMGNEYAVWKPVEEDMVASPEEQGTFRGSLPNSDPTAILSPGNGLDEPTGAYNFDEAQMYAELASVEATIRNLQEQIAQQKATAEEEHARAEEQITEATRRIEEVTCSFAQDEVSLVDKTAAEEELQSLQKQMRQDDSYKNTELAKLSTELEYKMAEFDQKSKWLDEAVALAVLARQQQKLLRLKKEV